MTTDEKTILTIEEQKERDRCEFGIQMSFWIKVEFMDKIESERLYRDQYGSFGEWLVFRYPELSGGISITLSTWRQWRNSLKAWQVAQDNGLMLANEHAARELRKADDLFKSLVVQLAFRYHQMKYGDWPAALTAAMIRPIIEELKSVMGEVGTTGHVDLGDGHSTAFTAAIETALQERILRQRQHITDGAKTGGWQYNPSFVWSGILPDDLLALPTGTQLEFKWRIVAKKPEDNNGI